MENNSSESAKPTLDQQIFQLSQLTEQIHSALALGDTAELESIYDNLAHLTNSLSQLSTQVAKQKEERDNYLALATISQVVNSSLQVDEVLRIVMDTIVRLTGAERGFLMLKNNLGELTIRVARNWEQETLNASETALSRTVVNRVVAEGQPILTTNAQQDPRFDGQESVISLNLRSILCVPLKLKESIIGVIYADNRLREGLFTETEKDLLAAFANQAAVAIENARLFQENLEKQRMEEELNIARDLQMSMLPAACPEVKGFHIAASSTPAREVGGDFYDFIEMDEGKIGLVVGDVTGKSVSGALVMSSSRSVFRMLSEEKLTVADIMARANRRIKKDIKTGMFVALLYAVLDSVKGKVNLCSAGQTQPIHFSARDGEAVLVETKGDNFPLGILDQADYQETEIWLPPGDTVVFYTDGIVEAMNEKEEIFGFERLLELIKQAGSVSAEELHQRILDKVSEFVGTAEPHDDLTVIVMSMER